MEHLGDYLIGERKRRDLDQLKKDFYRQPSHSRKGLPDIVENQRGFISIATLLMTSGLSLSTAGMITKDYILSAEGVLLCLLGVTNSFENYRSNN